MIKKHVKDSSKKWGLVFKIKNSKNKRYVERYAKRHDVKMQKGKDPATGIAYYCILSLPGYLVEEKRKLFGDFIGEMSEKCNRLTLSVEYDKSNNPLFIVEESES